jgi:predicted phosphodiesterase
MPFDRNHKILLVRFGGALTRQALESMVRAAREFVAVHGNCDGIVDFSAVEKVDVDVAYLRAYGGARA